MTPLLAFPLRGEWRAISTPAERVPSHGTDFFGQRYAFDFVRMDESGTWYYPGAGRAMLRHVTVGVRAAEFHCWDQPVHSAFDGRVIIAADGWSDIARVQWIRELIRTSMAAPRIRAGGDHRPLAGNHVLVEGGEGVALYAHLRSGSVRAPVGRRVATGDVLGTVGNSGNTTMPHLHFHLMDGPDPLVARGLPCEFRDYERWTGIEWERVARGVPGRFERIRVHHRMPAPVTAW